MKLLRTFVLMKNAFRNIISVLLAVLVLSSTLSFTVSKHYCGNFLVDTAIFTPARTCGMEAELQSISPSKTLVHKTPCCKDTLQVVKGQDELKNAFDILDFKKLVFTQTTQSAYHNFLKPIESTPIFCSKYSPPPIIRNFTQWYGTFLI
ncbi:HYC_CC_PP family protein [Aquimarina intermedia]|uniref:Secreted protein n=1 Tax=Aquimarina intermedia TaxID=350814 RepID=A0A5S5CF33_9FLAO|nr:hypothetical protein [Aquimarina intermedia]TYP77278.1 hypothetical protein BD809_101431 [Aquimarina intermedia]